MALRLPTRIFDSREMLRRRLDQTRIELQAAGNDLTCYAYLQATPGLQRQYDATERSYAELWEEYRRLEREYAQSI